MKLTIELTSENKKDLALIKPLTDVIVSVLTTTEREEPVVEEHEDDEKPKRTRRKKAETTTSEPVVEAPTVEETATEEEAPITEEPVVEAPAVEEPVVEAPSVEAPVVEAPEPRIEGTQSELPFVVEKNTAEQSEFQMEFIALKKRLQVEPGMEYGDMYPLINDYIHKLSELYGDKKPSKLTPESRYKLIQDMKASDWNEEHTGFEIRKAPF